MLEERKAQDTPFSVLCHKKDGSELIFQRITELPGQLLDIPFWQGSELHPKDLLHLGNGVLICMKRVVMNTPDA
jgi:hypothetical protein